MTLYLLDPLTDPRWPPFVDGHPNSSVFHTRGWLQCLQQTYGYPAIAVTGSAPGRELESALPLCRVHSWLTGRRMVSLPFSDHCDALTSNAEELPDLLRAFSSSPDSRSAKYVEIRPLDGACFTRNDFPGFSFSRRFLFHRIDLRPGANIVYERLHKDCIRRKIRRAEHVNIRMEQGQNDELLQDFYRLHLRTRRRQGMVPQPFAWFRNLAACLGASMQVRVAYWDTKPVAALLTLTHRDRIVYKYGASHARHNALGGTQLLFWRTIQEACAQGFQEFDLGRTDCRNTGLAEFKERLGATAGELVYFRNSGGSAAGNGIPFSHVLSRALVLAPLALLRAAGTLFYRHAG